jgi:arylsulfatase A-like enzyme
MPLTTRRDFLKYAGAGAAALALPKWLQAAEAAPATAAGGRKPNIVYILADDIGYGDVGCYGATKVKTPNIDRLAKEGVRFTDAHAVSAVCTPSRYSLLTGEYAFRVNSWGPHAVRGGLIIDPAKMTLARLLKNHGYATACIGKWHLGFGATTPDWNGDLKPGPLELGFDYYYGIPQVSSGPPFVYVENHRVVGLDPADPLVYGGDSPTQHYPEKNTRGMSGAKAAHALYKDEELGSTLAAKAVGWLRARRDEPFFLYFATPLIHHPFTPNPRFQGTSQCGPYGDFVQELDWMVGEVLKTLDELKLVDNTLVIFTSDNGGMLNGGGKTAWQAGHRLNGDLLGFKFGAWEGGHRVPFIARWPGRIAPGARAPQLIANVDMLATVAAIVGYERKTGEGIDSVNVLPALLGNPGKPVREEVVLAPFSPRQLALRRGRWLYIQGQGSGGFDNGLKEIAFTHQQNSDITSDGIIKPDAPPVQLYDLETDPLESTNVCRQQPEVLRTMQSLLEKIWNAGPNPGDKLLQKR